MAHTIDIGLCGAAHYSCCQVFGNSRVYGFGAGGREASPQLGLEYRAGTGIRFGTEHQAEYFRRVQGVDRKQVRVIFEKRDRSIGDLESQFLAVRRCNRICNAVYGDGSFAMQPEPGLQRQDPGNRFVDAGLGDVSSLNGTHYLADRHIRVLREQQQIRARLQGSDRGQSGPIACGNAPHLHARP